MASIAKYDAWTNTAGVFYEIPINYKQYTTTATTYYSGSANQYLEITDLAFNYTPVSPNSKILIRWEVHLGIPSDNSVNVRLIVNNNWDTYLGNTGTGYRSSGPSIFCNNTSAVIWPFEGSFLFQNTNLNTVSLKFAAASQNGAYYLNRGYSYDDSSRQRTPSSWIITEIQTQ